MRSLTAIDADITALHAAREAVLKTGQAFSVGPRTWSRANLADLQALLQVLQAERARALASQAGFTGDGIMTASFD